MTPRTTWHGRRVAPRTEREAWVAFWRETGIGLALVAGVAGIAVVVDAGDVNLRPRTLWDYLWLKAAVVATVPLILTYEIALLRARLDALRAGDVHVEPDEADPAAVPPPSRRRRKPTPAQLRRARAFRLELVLVTALWLFLAGAAAVGLWLDLRAGRPLMGQAGKLLAGLVVLYVVYLVATFSLKRDADRGLS